MRFQTVHIWASGMFSTHPIGSAQAKWKKSSSFGWYVERNWQHLLLPYWELSHCPFQPTFDHIVVIVSESHSHLVFKSFYFDENSLISAGNGLKGRSEWAMLNIPALAHMHTMDWCSAFFIHSATSCIVWWSMSFVDANAKHIPIASNQPKQYANKKQLLLNILLCHLNAISSICWYATFSP